MIPELIAVAIGCALGGIARYGLAGLVDRRRDSAFPLGTLVVNASGSFAIGVAVALLATAGETGLPLHGFSVVGFLGSYTTVSAFSLQTMTLLRAGDRGLALSYVVITVAACLGAVVIGAALGAGMAGGS